MQIRQATPDDRAVLITLTTKFVQLFPPATLLHLDITKVDRLVDLVLRHGAVFVADVHTLAGLETVAMIGLLLVDHPGSTQRFGEECALWVDPAFRKGIIGPRLVRAAENWARMLGLTMIKMGAPAGSRLGPFFETLGYTAVETAYQKTLI